MNQKIVILVLALLMLSGLAVGCADNQPTTPAVDATESAAISEESGAKGGSDPAETVAKSKNFEVAWIYMGASTESALRCYDGFTAYIANGNLDWKVIEMDSEGSTDKLATNIEDAVSKGVDMIICTMADLRSCSAALETVKAAGIPILSIDSGYTEGLICDITCNNYVMSSKVSAYLIDSLGGSGNICTLTFVDHQPCRIRGEIFNVVAGESPGIKVLDDHVIDYTNFYADCQRTVEDWISRYGDDLDAIWCAWDEPAIAASDVLKAAGKNNIKIIGIDGNDTAIGKIRDENDPMIATVAQPLELIGRRAAQVAESYVIEGGAWEDVVGSSTIYVDAPLITGANVPAEGTPAYSVTDFYSMNLG